MLACGGTGGHLFPGLAVAERLRQHGSCVTLVISPKEVDQQAIRQAVGLEVLTLPAVGLVAGRRMAFITGFIRSYRRARTAFRTAPPHAALAMGGFTSAAPVLAAKLAGAETFLHESNAIPGRANRWLSWIVARAFVGFPTAAARLRVCPVKVTGTPVRGSFRPRAAEACRADLGLAPTQPVVLVMGGSQGASALNQAVISLLPSLGSLASQWQWIHLTGPNDVDAVKQAYAECKAEALVRPFAQEMELIMGAATVALSRAGASSLAELAAMRLPAVLVPYPAATDNHQFLNARAFAESGAAQLQEQRALTPPLLLRLLCELMHNAEQRQSMQTALGQWHHPDAADQIAQAMLAELCKRNKYELKEPIVAKTQPPDGTRLLVNGSSGWSGA
jgi:UDP-N-acetylglucosamine--N-acetylmuramyl-(pentapeptide) pyrophosphoryl-undecaprenol N-acetylglucosamine transferase